MKKLFWISLITFCLSVSASAHNGNIWLDFEDKQLSAEQVINLCKTEYNLLYGSELVLVRTVEDNIGMTHYTYQQFLDGIKVEGCYLLVHMRDNYVSTVNGRLLKAENFPSERIFMPRKQLKAKIYLPDGQEPEALIFEYQGSFYSAYKYFDQERFVNVYLDAKNGDVITEISIINYADANGTALTMYSGWQNIVYDVDNGNNTLHDNSRQIITADASTLSPQDANSLNMTDIFSTCSEYTNPTSEWYTPVLTSVTITWAAQSWWYNALTDASPDFYIRVKKNGTVLYESGYYNDANPPVTFNIPVVIEADGNISIEVCDYDGALGSDDSAGSVNITKTTAGTYSWNNSKTQATYTISKASHPALDVHWGMEKVYDFYLNKFNHRSYDGQGSAIIQLVNPPSSLPIFSNNGFPNQSCAFGGTGVMAYGFGDGITCNPLVSLDIMGHEFTHMVTGANGNQNLPNSGEGGALNESFGDIMGNAIEAYAWGEPDWLVGTGTVINTNNHAGRSISDPKSMDSPNTYQGSKWKNITGSPNVNTNDNDWVHVNCGVQNYWFYLLCNGGSGHIDDKTTNEAYSVVGIGMDKAIQIVYRNLMTYITSTSIYADSRNGSIQAAIDLYGQDSQEHQSVMNAWHAVGVGDRYIAPSEPITIKAKMPANWGSTISAWAWVDGSEGSWVTLTKEGDWYSYTSTLSPLNIVFVNGAGWNGDNNQSADIRLSGSACIQLGSNTSGKRNYTLIDCPNDDFQLTPGKYVVVANRDKTGDKNWYYMTSDLGSASTKRFQAVTTGTEDINEIVVTELADQYVWELEADGDNWKLKNGTQYITWTSGNSANLDATGKSLTFEIAENQVQAHFNDGTSDRYLSLNATTNNNYFAFYGNTNQISYLYFLPYEEEIQPQSDNYVVLARRSAGTNWFYMTSDLGTASNKRYQAVDAGTTSLANVNTSNLDSKYYWQIEDTKLHTEAGYSTWTSGNTANLGNEGKDLTIVHQANGTYTFSFADGTDTRYLALNATAGNNYFAYYKGINQIYQLTLIKEGEHGSTVDLEEIPSQEPTATKILHNGQIFILRGEKVYTLQGQEVR